jgi:hypothetical protein
LLIEHAARSIIYKNCLQYCAASDKHSAHDLFLLPERSDLRADWGTAISTAEWFSTWTSQDDAFLVPDSESMTVDDVCP